MAKKKIVVKKTGFFAENWRLLVMLLLPMVLILCGIIVLILYESNYAFRQSFDQWWQNLTSSSSATTTTKKIVIVPDVPTYKEEHVAECQAMPDKYRLENPGDANPIDLLPSIGLEPGADRKAVAERCKAFAKIVTRMDSLSPQRHYAFLCPGTRFFLGKGFGFIPDPAGNAVLIASSEENAETQKIEIPVGGQNLYRQWQFYNIGDGCYVMGYSTNRSRALEVMPAQ